ENMTKGKQSLKELKKDIEDYKREITNLAEELFHIRPIFEENKKLLENELNEFANIQQDIERLKGLNLDEEEMNEKELQELLDNQLVEINNQTESIDYMQAQSTLLKSKLASEEDQVSKLQREVEFLMREENRLKNEIDSYDRNDLDNKVVYEQDLEHIKRSLGLSVEFFNGEIAKFTFEYSQKSFLIEIKLKRHVVISVKVVGCNYSFDDLIVTCKQIGYNLNYLIHSIMNRLKVIVEREKEYSDIASQYQSKPDFPNLEFVEIINLQSKRIYNFKMQADYPLNDCKVELVAVFDPLKKMTMNVALSLIQEHAPHPFPVKILVIFS
ncbi:hypothetical protein ROZALSC1DRAFT_25785, partial [Rozella allomycis CSF55]